MIVRSLCAYSVYESFLRLFLYFCSTEVSWSQFDGRLHETDFNAHILHSFLLSPVLS